MSDSFFAYEGANFHFLKSGNGPKALLAFHGFGQDHKAFKGFLEKFPGQYTMFSFDLFFHGKSKWNRGEKPLEKSFWQSMLEEFLVQNHVDRFSLLGFSMGGKFVLATIEAFPEKIDSVYLLAPDGIKTSTWYSLATYPLALREIFKSMVSKPNRFHQIVNLAFKIGIIDKSLLSFAESQMNTKEKRERVYYSWVVFRHLKFKMPSISTLINNNNIMLTLVIGKYDKIITLKNMNGLLKRIKQPTLEILETGHNGLISKWIWNQGKNL